MVLIPLLLAGCPSSEFSPSWLVDRTRVLAVVPEVVDDGTGQPVPGLAEARPGQTLGFQALVVNPEHPIAVTAWFACLPEQASDFGCEIDQQAMEELAGADPSTMGPEELQALWDRLAELGFIGVEPGFPPAWTAPEDVLDGLTDAEASEGLNLVVQLAAMPEDAAGLPDESDLELAFKRVPISLAPTPNHDPEIDHLRLGGLDVPAGSTAVVPPGATCTLEPVLAEDAVEDYVFIDSDGTAETRTEEPYIDFYTTGGELSRGYSLPPETAVDWTAPSRAGDVTIWVTIRDRRGGMGWLEQRVRVERSSRPVHP